MNKKSYRHRKSRGFSVSITNKMPNEIDTILYGKDLDCEIPINQPIDDGNVKFNRNIQENKWNINYRTKHPNNIRLTQINAFSSAVPQKPKRKSILNVSTCNADDSSIKLLTPIEVPSLKYFSGNNSLVITKDNNEDIKENNDKRLNDKKPIEDRRPNTETDFVFKRRKRLRIKNDKDVVENNTEENKQTVVRIKEPSVDFGTKFINFLLDKETPPIVMKALINRYFSMYK